jgi:putative tryptophan/tyrosine transport system substrate-binding protein
MKRAAVPSILIGVTLLAVAVIAEAQQAKKVPRIGYLISGSPSSTREIGEVEAFRQGLRELGYVEGQNIAIEYRYAEGVDERLLNLATELVQLNVDLIFVSGTIGTQAAKNATQTIPIVMTSVTDPVGTGLVSSLAHPGGNVTGLSNLSELSGKQLELLKEAFPKITRVAVLWDPANTANARLLGEMKVAGGGLRITLQPLEVNGPDDFQPAFSAIKKERASALIVLRNVITYTYGTRIVDLTAN